MSNEHVETREEFAIAYGDGEIDDDTWDTRLEARQHLAFIRERVKEGRWDDIDYPEPMRIVKRTVTKTTTATPWEDA